MNVLIGKRKGERFLFDITDMYFLCGKMKNVSIFIIFQKYYCCGGPPSLTAREALMLVHRGLTMFPQPGLHVNRAGIKLQKTQNKLIVLSSDVSVSPAFCSINVLSCFVTVL